MDTFLTILQNLVQNYISVDPTELALCSMRSTPSELLVAPLACLRLASLVNKHRLFAQHDRTLVDGKDLVR